MTEQHVATMMDRLLDERLPHLNDDVTRTVSKRVFVRRPPEAVVMHLNTLRSRAWGTCRSFTTLGSVEVYC